MDKTFNEGRQNEAGMHQPGRSSISEAEVNAVATLAYSDRPQKFVSWPD